MNKRGRPPKCDGEEKICQYRLRMSKDEAAVLDNLSREFGLNKAEILRRGLRLQRNLLLYGHN